MIINAQPRLSGNQFVFTGRGGCHFNNFSEAKARLDAKLPKQMEPWRLHDL
jgi:hypothetical protein